MLPLVQAQLALSGIAYESMQILVRAMADTSRVDSSYGQRLMDADAVLVPARSSVDAMARSGVQLSKVSVLPMMVDRLFTRKRCATLRDKFLQMSDSALNPVLSLARSVCNRSKVVFLCSVAGIRQQHFSRKGTFNMCVPVFFCLLRS